MVCFIWKFIYLPVLFHCEHLFVLISKSDLSLQLLVSNSKCQLPTVNSFVYRFYTLVGVQKILRCTKEILNFLFAQIAVHNEYASTTSLTYRKAFWHEAAVIMILPQSQPLYLVYSNSLFATLKVQGYIVAGAV